MCIVETKWAQGDEDVKRQVLKAVFVRLVVDQRKIVDMEVKNPYNWLLRWKPSSQESALVPDPWIAVRE